ncbi:carbohydrate ABC transporter permease [Paenibacillus sp. N4]|uniref:carbohydrate ABC transporter permease n=1 Tax=Paenibacillus vietnamensis TaxID=2590547 RepID=UPI001CD0ECF7|nr:carbohydrate ABC transporter permease [Paenibacillus vietnamensis]MCA0753446.1 carbohydrate ABC transporter permease [Paenibacillus vietnamensis]
MHRRTVEDRIVDTLNISLLVIIALVTMYPFFYLIIVSFNNGLDTSLGGIYFWPRDFTLNNYAKFLSDPKWLMAFGVSGLRTAVGAAVTIFFTCLTAYGLAYRNLVFHKFYFSFFIVAMYMSGGLIPYYVVLRSLGLLNSFAVYIVPGAVTIFFLIIAVSFFREIPAEMEESARIDGASDLTIFFKMILPVSKPLIAAMGLFIGVGQWNSWMDSAYFVNKDSLRTLTYRMMEVINQGMIPTDLASAERAAAITGVTTFSIQVTAMVIAVIPILLVYPFLQKYFVQGIMIGSVKG